jgi:hypothetical protein
MVLHPDRIPELLRKITECLEPIKDAQSPPVK